ncbi:uncharacterized protein C8R40DRAFT_1167752 [Lentinula edodes]|uniref:uncharacterized protein n=1 Tax=Lentinula edodes TaxID=5353 RepID=UPI001E8D3E37|nr:uncharacterized protein C8R40DRAFT_1167752 [Lentinula edodes]KAH7878327.1 hypothetical protein C8R40DRAFT_1167752 [Lentinula edodes]
MEEDYLGWKDGMWEAFATAMGVEESQGGNTAGFAVCELDSHLEEKVYLVLRHDINISTLAGHQMLGMFTKFAPNAQTEAAIKEFNTNKEVYHEIVANDCSKAGEVLQLPVPPKKDRNGCDNPADTSMKRSLHSSASGSPHTKHALIKAETPLTKMPHQLDFKLQVKMQYKYQADGDKKSRQDAESKKIESEKKIQLLPFAQRRYKNLHFLDDALAEEEEEPNSTRIEGEWKETLRAKPLSGTLSVAIQGARELDHAPIITRFRSSKNQVVETSNEDFEIAVDKANEVETALYDKQVGGTHAVPIILLWIRISDLVEALRRQKVFMESGQGGWVPSGAMHGDAGHSNSADPNIPLSFGAAPPGGFGPQGSMGDGIPQQPSEGIEAWFSVEPAGAILLHLELWWSTKTSENARSMHLSAVLVGIMFTLATRLYKLQRLRWSLDCSPTDPCILKLLRFIMMKSWNTVRTQPLPLPEFSISHSPTPPYPSSPLPSASPISTYFQKERRTDDELETLYDEIWTGNGARGLRNFENAPGVEAMAMEQARAPRPAGPAHTLLLRL